MDDMISPVHDYEEQNDSRRLRYRPIGIVSMLRSNAAVSASNRRTTCGSRPMANNNNARAGASAMASNADHLPAKQARTAE
jgi:hypothetical protein